MIAPAGTQASIKVGETVINSYDSTKISDADITAAKEAATKKVADLTAAAAKPEDLKKATDALAAFEKDAKGSTAKAKEATMTAGLSAALKAAGYPAKADPAKVNKPMIVLILTYLVLLVTMVYGPIAAMLVVPNTYSLHIDELALPHW